jgi:hypothetical protein
MKFYKEILISALFFALYIPISLAVWYTDQSLDLVVIMLIGLIIVLTYFATILTIDAMKKPRKRIITNHTPREYHESESEESEDDMIGFRRLFLENKNGGIAT